MRQNGDMANNQITTIYRETGKLIDRVENVCRVQIGCEIRYIHATKVFRGGKSIASEAENK